MLEWLTWDNAKSLSDSELTWANLKSLGNSSFITSLAGALAGAFFGASAAQRIAERGKQSDQLLAEFRSTNSALTLAFTICNVALAFKRQHAKPLHEHYFKARADLIEFERKRDAGEIGNGVRFSHEADLKTLQPPVLPLALLEKQVFDRLSVSARPQALVSAIAAEHVALAISLERRGELIATWNAMEQRHFQSQIATAYFGLPGEKTVDTRYADSVRAMLDQANNLIFFSELLCEDLAEHGKNLQQKAQSRVLKRQLKKLNKLDFSKARKDGEMPDRTNYADWFTGFVTTSKKPTILGRLRRPIPADR